MDMDINPNQKYQRSYHGMHELYQQLKSLRNLEWQIKMEHLLKNKLYDELFFIPKC
jgi:hypothetical protein